MTLDELNADTRRQNFTAGWNKTTPSLWKEPRTQYRPKLWRYADARAALHRAGDLVSTELAERRNLLMFDDADENQYATTRTIVAAYQMLKPGEHARAHRHSPNALRLVLEADEGIATVVDGIELPMRAGSVLLTPGRTWHSHFSKAARDAYWIDVLDVPLVQHLEPMFFDPHPNEFQTTEQKPEVHEYLKDAAEIERRMAPSGPGVRVAELSSESMPTLSIQALDFAPAASMDLHEAANGVFAVMAGAGHVTAPGLSADIAFGDLLSIPMWHRAAFTSAAGMRLLHVSDRPVMRMLGFHRTGPA